MKKQKKEDTSSELLNVIIDAIKEKKGRKIVSINLRKIEHSVCNYFVICHASSTTQVGAIVEEIRKKTTEILSERPNHVEGEQNSLWVLIDYFDTVVHVFLEDQRYFYNLEDLWADGITTEYGDE
jgi:ribosome-associated protein